MKIDTSPFSSAEATVLLIFSSKNQGYG